MRKRGDGEIPYYGGQDEGIRCAPECLRLKKRFVAQALEGLLRKSFPHPPYIRISQELEEEIMRLRTHLYFDSNILHFQEKPLESHGIMLSHETLRRVLMRNGLHTPKAKRKLYWRRRRIPKAGLLVQIDSSRRERVVAYCHDR